VVKLLINSYLEIWFSVACVVKRLYNGGRLKQYMWAVITFFLFILILEFWITLNMGLENFEELYCIVIVLRMND